MFGLKNQSGSRRIPVAGLRGLRAAVSRARKTANPRRKDVAPLRARRGTSAAAAAPWRRCTMGPNRISSLGVWKRGARREAVRANRAGGTQWLRPYRPRPGIGVAEPGDAFRNETA